MTEKTYTPGRAVWRELMTDDVEKAKAFYGGLFGWRFEDAPMGEGAPPYPIAHVGDKQVAGLAQKPAGAPMPTFWLTYFSAPEIDAAIDRAKQHGGTVAFGPIDVPQVGRIATVMDFAGAAFGLLSSSNGDQPMTGRPQRGELCWESISTPDVERAKRFYAEVFGWVAQPSPGGTGTVLGVGSKMEDGVADLQKAEHMPPAWMTYVVVDTVENARAKAEQLGAKVVVPLIEIPQVGRIGFIVDPTGGFIGLFQPQMA